MLTPQEKSALDTGFAAAFGGTVQAFVPEDLLDGFRSQGGVELSV